MTGSLHVQEAEFVGDKWIFAVELRLVYTLTIV